MNQAEKVRLARENGVRMGSVFNGAVIGWTTNEALATYCHSIGCQANPVPMKSGEVGWEIVALPDPPEPVAE
jgi:hypothetical protein